MYVTFVELKKTLQGINDLKKFFWEFFFCGFNESIHDIPPF